MRVNNLEDLNPPANAVNTDPYKNWKAAIPGNGILWRAWDGGKTKVDNSALRATTKIPALLQFAAGGNS